MQLTLQYKEKRRVVDEMKEDLQKRIAEYAKLTEKGSLICKIYLSPI